MGSLGKVGRYASEDVVLSLVRSKCLPVLLYVTEVCPLLSRDLSSISFALTRVLTNIFCSRSHDVINECREVFGILPIKQQMQLRKVRFLQNVIDSDKLYAHYLSVMPQANCCACVTHIQQMNALLLKE